MRIRQDCDSFNVDHFLHLLGGFGKFDVIYFSTLLRLCLPFCCFFGSDVTWMCFLLLFFFTLVGLAISASPHIACY